MKKAYGDINTVIYEDDGKNAIKYFQKSKVDIVIFEHSVNDILQTILAENNGLNTLKNNWFKLLPQMIELINNAYENNQLIEIKPHFLEIMQNCANVLKTGGYMVFSHYMFQYDLNLGYNS